MGTLTSGKETDNKKPSVKEVISTFCGYTTAHGLGRLADGGGIFRRVSWSLFCVGALVMFIVQTYNLFVIYLSRPVTTVVNVQHESVSSTCFSANNKNAFSCYSVLAARIFHFFLNFFINNNGSLFIDAIKT